MIPKQTTTSALALAAWARMTMATPVRPREDVSPPAATAAAGPYEATWESTNQHNAAPEWFRDAKFGVYWHWGAFSVAEYGSEWYPRNLYRSDTSEHAHHLSVYGDPVTRFGQHNFTLGGTDLAGNYVKFDPVPAEQGGEWNTTAWLDAVVASGARFAGPVAEHHDGFSMWNSTVNQWNSVALGPKLDLVKIWADLVRERGLKLVIAMHQAFNVNGYYAAAPNYTDPEYRKFYGQWDDHAQASEWWLAKQIEALDHVQPDIVWNDFSLWSPGYCQGDSDICGINEPQRLAFLAHYFNRGVEWGKEVLTTYKDFDAGFNASSAVEDYERGGPAELTRPYWQTDDAISSSSWSYTVGMGYYSSIQMVHSLLDRVSKNGNLLLNISPTAAGVIPDAQIQVLKDIGTYLARYGEAVYSTRAWDIYGEGPNTAGGGSFSGPFQGNSSDLRFTRSQDEKILYAHVLGWPANGTVNVANLGSDRAVDVDGLENVQLLGETEGEYLAVQGYTQNAGGLLVTLPSTQPGEAFGYVLKFTFKDRIPVPQPLHGATVWPEGGKVDDTTKGVTLGLGNFTSAFLDEAGVAGPKVGEIIVSAGSTVSVYGSTDLSGDVAATYTEGTHTVALGSVGSISIAAA